MQLVILETALGLDVACLLVDGEHAVGDDPLGGGFVLRGNPLVEILAVKQDDCVGRRSPAGCARSHNFRHRLLDFGVFGFCLGLSAGLPLRTAAEYWYRT